MFWCRRFFRLAPLYYPVLIVALVFGAELGHARNAIAIVVPASATPTERYSDTSIVNLLLHLSFVFGTVPAYSFRTALPDWSIGLEAQYYAVFPFLMLVWLRYGPMRTAISVMLICIAFRFVTNGYWHAFIMPSLLPMKLPMFLSGMIAAEALVARDRTFWFLVALACLLAVAPSSGPQQLSHLTVRPLFPFALALLPAAERLAWSPLGRINAFLSSAALRLMGDVSYSVYLLHLLVLIPIAAMIDTRLASAPAIARTVLALPITLGIVYPLAWLSYCLIERSGIRLGKHILGRRPTEAPMASPVL